MAKRKRKLTPAEKRARKKRREETMMIFIHGKQKRVKRPPMIDGMPVEEFLRRNADPVWLHQNEMWHLIDQESEAQEPLRSKVSSDEWAVEDFDLQEVNKYLASLANRPCEEI